VLAFRRGPRFACYVNFGSDPVELPPDAAVLLASLDLEGGRLPSDACVWLELPPPS
jgi:alpha-glucosidase